MRTIIAGSRSFDCGSQDHYWPSLACTKCRRMVVRIGEIVAKSGIDVTTVISGGAKGIDRYGELWASSEKIPIQKYIPEWTKYGKAAGPKRNRQMISEGLAEAAIVIWDGVSPGSYDMFTAAQAAGLVAYLHDVTQKPKKGRSSK
jgi:predicted Rossmann fold nucleotide-binding protein DprA/Smf involved in DNA uptake